MAHNTLRIDNIYTQRLDESIRPQDDFFAYVNNKWLKAHPIPASESARSSFHMLRDEAWQNLRGIYETLERRPKTKIAPNSIEQQARDLYYTALHNDKFEPTHRALLAAYFRKIDAISNPTELTACIGELQAIGVEVGWSVAVDIDDKDSSRHIFRIGQGGLTLPDRDYYLDKTAKMKNVRKQLGLHIEKVRGRLDEMGTSGTPTLGKSVLAFEHALAEHARSSAALRDVEKNYHKTSFAELRRKYPKINWQAYTAAIGWRPSDQISVDQPDFLKFINSQCTPEQLPAWRAYLKWQVAVTYYGKISEPFAELRQEFFGAVLSGTTAVLPRWKRAVLNVDHLIGPGVGRLYAEEYFPESSKQQVLDMVETIRATYRRRLERLDWMNATTKHQAIKKLKNIKVLIGYPDKWRDFSALTIGRTSYIANVIAAEKFQTEYYLHRLHEPASRDEWLMNPQTVNAYSDLNRLVICFPAAILQAPFFDPAAPAAANYGGIGMVIGHELTHSFDDQGYRYDANGNLHTWQTAADRAQFKKRARLIIDQANQFTVLPGLTLKGGLVVGESIADLGGVEIAFEAFRSLPAGKQRGADGLSAKQLFFIAYTITECGATREERKRELALSDPHPDSTFRVNGILANVDDFYVAFNVAKADALYRPPAKRAKIW